MTDFLLNLYSFRTGSKGIFSRYVQKVDHFGIRVILVSIKEGVSIVSHTIGRKIRIIAVMVALFGIGLVTNSVSAHAAYFNYYQNNQPKKLHKTYTSKKSYSVKKTFTFNTNYKLKVNNVYLYQVSKKHSNYPTWAKITGTAYNNTDNGYYRFGAISAFDGIVTNYVGELYPVSSTVPNHFAFSQATSLSPKMFNIKSNGTYTDFLGPHKSEKFELLLHSKKAVTKQGETSLRVNTICINSTGNYNSGYAWVNVNLK